MRILIQGYQTADSSQCDYFSDRLNRMDGVTCGVWSGEGGLYEVMDNFKPDAYVAHLANFDNDMFTYIKDADTTPLKKLILVANNCKHQSILESDKILKGLGYDAHTYITNNLSHLSKAPENTVYLSAAADMTAVELESIDYDINTLVVIDKQEELGEAPLGTYHTMSTNSEMKGKVDICLPLIQFSALLKNYKNVSIRTNSHVLQQIYYDAVMSGCNVTIDSSNSHCKDRLLQLISQLKKDQDSVRDTVLREHLSQHRAEKLLSLIPAATTERYFTV